MFEVTPLDKDKNRFAEQAKVFSEYFPDGTIREISADEVPAEAMKFFEMQSGKYLGVDQYTPGNFENFFCVDYKSGGKTFVAQQTKVYPRADTGTEKAIYVYDVGSDDDEIGYGEIRFNISIPSKYFKAKPFVGYTSTESDKRKQGFGQRRLYVMNALAEMRYGLSLNSDSLIESAAERVWKSLVAKGEARVYREGKYNRYVFIRKKDITKI